MERKLAAILAADVVGYSALMEADEAGTLRRMTALRRDLIEPLLVSHRGRIVKLMGDGLLVEFASVVDAVACAAAWQDSLAEHDAATPESKKLRFRIGINLGDIIIEGDDIYGDGVNIAARLEGLAEAGGICLSGDVYRQVKGKSNKIFEDMGEQRLKNLTEPVRVYRLAPKYRTEAATPLEPGLAGKPSIAVLPFKNMSGDREQDYFSDGITEDVMTELGRFGTFHVVARSASFNFKETPLSGQEVGRKLGVPYLVEGSVRRAGNRVRITVQLLETETGKHLWAERYDRDLEDIFAVQDDLTQRIVGVLPGRVERAVAEGASRKRTDNMKAYELLLKGKAVRDSFSIQDTLAARQLFERAIALDPHYAKAHAYLADTYFMDIFMGLGNAESAELSLRHARLAIEQDSADVANDDQLGFAYIGAGMWEDAAAQFDRAAAKVALEAEPMTWIGYGLLMLGRTEEAYDLVQRAIRLNPLHPPSFDWVLGQACFFTKRYEEVPRVLAGRSLLNAFAYACLAAAYGQLGRDSDAQRALKAFVQERQREFDSRQLTLTTDTVDGLAGGYRPLWRNAADWEQLAEGLRKAGLRG